MAWISSQSRSFVARHESRAAEEAAEILDALEDFRARLDPVFEVMPGEVAVVIHSRPYQLSLAHPWLPIARLAAAPASRRYFAGWFGKGEIHVLEPAALEERASGVPGSLEALRLSPLHEYAHLVVGANNPALPPPFGIRTFRRYLAWAWLCEGAATHFCGQTPLLRGAILRRVRDGPLPAFPPSARDAQLLGGSVFGLLEERAGAAACVALACRLDPGGAHPALERAFGLPLREVETEWRGYLARFAGER